MHQTCAKVGTIFIFTSHTRKWGSGMLSHLFSHMAISVADKRWIPEPTPLTDILPTVFMSTRLHLLNSQKTSLKLMLLEYYVQRLPLTKHLQTMAAHSVLHPHTLFYLCPLSLQVETSTLCLPVTVSEWPDKTVTLHLGSHSCDHLNE